MKPLFKYPLFFALTFFNGLLGAWDAQIFFFTLIITWIFYDWVHQRNLSRLFMSAWLTFAGVVTCNHLGAIHAAESHYRISKFSAVALHVGFSFVSQLPFAGLVLAWAWVMGRLKLTLVEKALTLPLALYLGDLFLPELFPSGLLTMFSFFRLPFNQLFSLVGIEGVKFFFYLGFVLLVLGGMAVVAGRRLSAGFCGGSFVLLCLLLLGIGQWERGRWSEFDSQMRVGIYQSNRQYDFTADEATRRRQEEELLADFSETVEKIIALGGKPEFILYSESEFLNFFDTERRIGERLRALATTHGVALFGGAETWSPTQQRQNTLLMVDANGQVIHAYHKRVLFPFGEYRPFSKSWPALSQFFPGAEVYEAGTSAEDSVHVLNQVKYGLSICYEDLFSQTYMEATGFGAEVLLSITSDGLFGNSFITLGHGQIARGRALEARRPLVRVVRSGPSFVLRADGEMLLSSPMGAAYHGAVDLQFQKSPRQTTYHRWAKTYPWLFALMTVVMVLAGKLARRTTLS